MLIKLMCFHFLIEEVKQLKKQIYDLQVKNFSYERKIKELEATLERYKIIVSNGYI